MNKGVFYFNFFDSETEIEKCYAFNISLLNDKLNVDFDDSYDQILDELESEYGVHDWVSYPNDAVIGFGYTSYEVDPDKYKHLMELWRGYFSSRADVDYVSEVVEVPVCYEYDDLNIYDVVAANA